MSRPRNKDDLIKAAREQYQKLDDLVVSLTEEELVTEFDFSGDPKKTERHWSCDKNLRDIYIHLYEWQQLLLNWIRVNEKGDEQPFIPETYSWKTYSDMNVEFWKKHQDTSLHDAKKMFEKSYAETLELAEKYTNEQSFGRGIYPWVNTDLDSYFVSVMPSHYDWAIKKLKAHRKNCDRA